jgi:tetratricopeptide (TPR) repeat protein
MMTVAERVVAGVLTVAWGLAQPTFGAAARAQKETPPSSTVLVQASQPACRVDVDGSPQGQTGPHGTFRDENVPPGDHYFHVQCPGEPARSYFVSLQAGKSLVLKAPAAGGEAAASPLDAAAKRHELQGLVLKAVSLRAQGNFDEAVELLRQATGLDPKNADLHRELGITFLLNKDWQRARIEMLEAIRHHPQDADAHNGLGYALEKLGNLAQAAQEYHQATRLDPDDSSYRQHYLDAQAKLAYQKYVNKKP